MKAAGASGNMKGLKHTSVACDRPVRARASLWNRNKMDELSNQVEETVGSALGNRGNPGVVGGLYDGWHSNTNKVKVLTTIMRGLSLPVSAPTASFVDESNQRSTKPAVNVSPFLKDESRNTKKLHTIRRFSSMSEQTYYVKTLTKEDIWKRYALKLVTSSHEYNISVMKDEIGMEYKEGDGMSASMTSSYEERSKENEIKTCDTSPCGWIVADDPNEPVRYIAIQGSDSVDHWVTNLSFEPVDFEQKDSNVKIHCGVYQVADELFPQLGAAVLDHIANHGKKARFIFMGHSLGGAIGTALVFLLVKRGVISGSMIEGIYTFGCPAFIYNDCSQASEGQEGGLLQDLGIDENVIHNVCMHRDIVPRAFACNFQPFWFFLKYWKEELKDFAHFCSAVDENKLRMTLYHHLGNMYFLQPDSDFLTFANPEGDHPMFPRKSGLYKMVEPPATLKMTMEAVNAISHSLQEDLASVEKLTLCKYARDMKHALIEVLNHPHPFEILKEEGAYGPDGAILRFHIAKNYTKALAAVLRLNSTN